MSAFRRAMNEPIENDVALLLLRLGVGLSMMLFHGWGKISGGPEMWERVGGSMGNLGLGFAPVFWGFMAAFAEFGCSALVVLGLFLRPAAAMLAFTMIVAVVTHLSMPPEAEGAGWNGASHALELLAVYLCLVFAGPGKYALMPRRTGVLEES
jgi:putative oxidoreductase